MDIREILAALTPDDRALWSEHRTAMRRSFLTAHNTTVGIGNWNANDDAFADLIDIQLALLFDRAGRLEAHKQLIDEGKADKLFADIHEQSDAVKARNLAKIDGQTAKNDIWPVKEQK